MFIKAAINGGRNKAEHPNTPTTPEEIATASKQSLDAGATIIHAHARTPSGDQTIEPEDINAMLRAIRKTTPNAIVGTTTGLWTCKDHEDRMDKIRSWEDLPDFASVAYGEEGAAEAAELILQRGMVLESAVWSLDEVPALLASSTLHENVRILIEPEESDPSEAVRKCRAMAEAILASGVECPLLYHGEEDTVWAVLDAAIEDDRELRIGFEDGLKLPNGVVAQDNVELISAVQARISSHKMRVG